MLLKNKKGQLRDLERRVKELEKIQNLLEVIMVVFLWRKFTQNQIRELLRIDISRISKVAQKLEKFRKQRFYSKRAL